MRRRFVAAFAVPVALLLTAGGVPDPLAPARDGKLQCYKPNTTRKTCGALAGYLLGDGGRISNPSSVLVASDPVIVMKSSVLVSMRGNAVCGTVKLADIDGATFTLNGRSATTEETVRLKQQMAVAMAADVGKEICTEFEAKGGGRFVTRSTVGGRERPDISQDVIWIGQGDGYTVAP